MMKTIKTKNFLYTFSKTFFLASTLCIFPAHADAGNTEKESKEALANKIQKLKEKIKKERAINIILLNKNNNDVKNDSNSGSATSPVSVTPEKPNPKFKFGGIFFASTTIQVVDHYASLVANGIEGGFSIFVEYKFANWFGLRSGIVTSKSRLYAPLPLLTIAHFSVPLTACFYPGKDRQWRLFVGPRFGKAMKVDVLSLGVIEKAAKKDLQERLFVFGDFGIDREGKNGFIFGLDGVGLRLGWNVAALF